MTEKLDAIQPYVTLAARLLLQFFMVVATIIFVAYALSAIRYPFALDYGEAPLVDQAMRLSQGQNIYPADLSTPPYTIANYPPLYVLALTPFVGNPAVVFTAGRVISVVAAVLTAVFLALITHTLSKNWLAALVAAVIFLAVPFVVYWSSLLRIDLLALLFSMAGLWLLVRWPASRVTLIGGGLLLVAAIYTRQSYALAAPLAAFAWLWTQQGRRRAVELAALVAGVSLLLFLLLMLLTGGGFFLHVIRANVNPFHWQTVGNWLQQVGDTMPLLILGALLVAIFGYKRLPGWPLLVAYLLGSFLSALTIGKVGSNANYLLELSAALSLLAGSLLAWRQANAPWQYVVALVLCTLQLGWLVRTTMDRYVDGDLSLRRGDTEMLLALEAQLNDVDGPILADEYMGLLTRNGRSLYLQPFEMTQLANAGVWDQTPLLQDLEAQTFPLVLIHHFSPFPVYRERWTPEMLAALDANYRPVQTMAGTVLYQPREGWRGMAANEPTINPTFVPEVALGEKTAVTDAAFITLPQLAISPANPDHLAMITTTATDHVCNPPDCKLDLLLAVSTDGGVTWDEQRPFTSGRGFTMQGSATFTPDGTLYVLGVRDGVVVTNSATADTGYKMTVTGQLEVTQGQVAVPPLLQSQPQTGELYLSYDSQLGGRTYTTPSLLRSRNGQRWSSISRADQRISMADFQTSFRAVPPDDVQMMFGEGQAVAMVWTWDAAPWTWPRDVWLATSSDGGRSFDPPQQLTETWGPITAGSENGRYYVLYRTGSETSPTLALATSDDDGASWDSVAVNGNVTLGFSVDKAAGLDIAPDGTVDVVFYAPAEPCDLTLESWGQQLANGSLVDHCRYDVYYSYSEDGSRFSQPVRLNEAAIAGEQFVQGGGLSQPGSHLGLASTAAAAYPIWLDNGTGEGVQAVTVRIER
ncbi:MAG: hypothetical protein R3C62_21290 [Chloroflexota bacterium]